MRGAVVPVRAAAPRRIRPSIQVDQLKGVSLVPWLKVSDTAAMNPIVLAALGSEDLWPAGDLDDVVVVNTLAGMVFRCATMSAGYLTDYVVSDGTVAQVAGRHWRHWARLAEQSGYWTRVETDGRPGWCIVQDPTHLLHLRMKDELDWERQRKKDAATPALIVPVRLRDGDACRYCGVVVNWGDQRGNRGATYDHAVPGQGATSPDDLRVACRADNARRSNDPDADSWCPPLPAPAQPHYGADTAALLAKHGHTVPAARKPRPGRQPGPLRDPAPSRTPQTASEPPRPGTQPDPAPQPGTAGSGQHRPPPPPPRATPAPPPHPRPGTQPAPAPRDPAPRGTTPPAETRPDRQPDHAPNHPPTAPPTSTNARSADSANRRSTGSGSAGTGRDGTGAHSPPVPADRDQRSRGRRGHHYRGRRPPPPDQPNGPQP